MHLAAIQLTFRHQSGLVMAGLKLLSSSFFLKMGTFWIISHLVWLFLIFFMSQHHLHGYSIILVLYKMSISQFVHRNDFWSSPNYFKLWMIPWNVELCLPVRVGVVDLLSLHAPQGVQGLVPLHSPHRVYVLLPDGPLEGVEGAVLGPPGRADCPRRREEGGVRGPGRVAHGFWKCKKKSTSCRHFYLLNSYISIELKKYHHITINNLYFY